MNTTTTSWFLTGWDDVRNQCSYEHRKMTNTNSGNIPVSRSIKKSGQLGIYSTADCESNRMTFVNIAQYYPFSIRKSFDTWCRHYETWCPELRFVTWKWSRKSKNEVRNWQWQGVNVRHNWKPFCAAWRYVFTYSISYCKDNIKGDSASIAPTCPLNNGVS